VEKVILFFISLLSITACTKKAIAPKISDKEITYRSEIVTTRNNVSGALNFDTILTMYIPNAFTPNGDGVNDVFHVYGTGIESFSLIIYDRWGATVFSTTDITKGWDGKVNNGEEIADSGVYDYQITATDKTTGSNHTYTGELILAH
jgi:gliding motility-associated-like protein